MNQAKAALIWCPFPDEKKARKAAGILLSEGLIACANILPQIQSVFQWEGNIASETEAVALLKTNSPSLEKAIERLGEIHPYETPAIVGWECDASHPDTLGWINQAVKPAR